MNFQQELAKRFEEASVKENIIPMQNYMKNNFKFYGIKSPERKAIFMRTYKQLGLPLTENYQEEVIAMMRFPKREMNYSAIDLALRCQKKYGSISDIDYITTLITTNSWWDSVDSLAPNMLGKYLLDYPQQIEQVLNDYMASNNMWLHRSCILFQLKYKTKMNKDILFALCDHFSSSKEFFIQKAIGWVLREYAKTNPAEVYAYVDGAELARLSKREANKHRL